MRPLLFAALILSVSPAQGSGIHSWTDAHGVRHFSDRPAARHGSRPYAPRSAPSPGPSQASVENPAQRAAAEQRRFDETLRRDAAREEQARRLRCQELKSRLDLLQQHPRLRAADAAGNLRLLADAERQALLDDIQSRLRVSCAR